MSSSILLVWTWANSSLSPPRQPLFTSRWQTIWMYAHTESRGPGWQSPAPSSWIERDKRFRSQTGSKTSWLIVALAEKSSERGLEILTEGNPIYRNSWPRYFAKQHVWMARFSDGTMGVYLMFAYGNHFPDIKTWLISKKRFKPL